MNAETQTDDSTTAGLTEEAVREYLAVNSDFFTRHPDLLQHLQLSHSSYSVASLAERQVSVLRERNTEIRRQLQHLTGNAQTNDLLYELTRQLLLRMLAADNLSALANVFTTAMTQDFDVQQASLILFGDPALATDDCRIESAAAAYLEIGGLIKNRSAVCGVLRREELHYLFPQTDAIGSAAVKPLCNGEDIGVIAIGNSDANYYTAGMGTLFLDHIAEVLAQLAPRLLQQEGDSEQP